MQIYDIDIKIVETKNIRTDFCAKTTNFSFRFSRG